MGPGATLQPAERLVDYFNAVHTSGQALRDFQEQQPAWYEGRKYLYLKKENGHDCLVLQTYGWLQAILYWFFEGTGIEVVERPAPLAFVAAFCKTEQIQEPEKLKACYHKYLDKTISYLQGPELATYTQIQKVVNRFCCFQPAHISQIQMKAITDVCGVTQEQYERLQASIMDEATIKTRAERRRMMSSILRGVFETEFFSHHKASSVQYRNYLKDFLIKACSDELLEPFIEKVISKSAAERLKKAQNPEECLRSIPLPSGLHLTPFYLDLVEFMHERMPEVPLEELSQLSQTDRKQFLKKALLAVTGALNTQKTLGRGQRFIFELVDRDALDKSDQRNYDGLLKRYFTEGSVGEVSMSLIYTPELIENPFFAEQLPESTLQGLISALGMGLRLEQGYALIDVLEKQKMSAKIQTEFQQARDKFRATIRRHDAL